MKKLSGFFVLICSFCGLQSQTNIYHKFLTEGAEWSELFITYTFEYDSITYIQHEGIFGDSVIDGKLYYRMGSFLMREDTINKKVYAQELGLGWPDTLLYDFNLNIGESAAHCAEFSVGNLFPDAVVTNIDSVLIGTYRKRWEIKYSPLIENGDSITYWIEGIGSENGIYNPFSSWYWPDIRRLVCYSENENVLYSDLEFWYDCSEVFEDTSDQIFDNAFENSIIVKPNPANKYLQISLESTRALNHCEFAVFNIAKQIVLKDSISGPNFTLDCSNFQEGLYFLLLFDGDKTYCNKFIVTH